MVLVRFPMGGVVQDIRTNIVKFAIVADDVIVVVALPNETLAMKMLIYKMRRKAFHRAYNIS